MKRSSGGMVVAGLLTTILIAACSTATRESRPEIVQPGTGVEVGRQPAPEASASRGSLAYNDADVHFIQRMIPHHAQALTMTGLVPTRTQREDIRRLAERIEVSQQDEIALMRRWLEDRGQEVPSLDPHHEHHETGDHHARMPGMLTREELARLEAARGAEFDRLFLELMIRHHEGALTMVAELFATPGAGQETELFRIASEVDADQRMEIERMRRLLNTPPSGGSHR